MEPTQRRIIEYTLKQKEDIEDDTIIVQRQIRKLERNSLELYDNQKSAAQQIVKNFQNRSIINQLVLGKTQSGKTGTMLTFIKINSEDLTNLIPIENIFIITGLSSVEWTIQTRKRFPEALHKRIYHRDKFQQFAIEVKNKQNVLIIMDEIQVASKDKQTIDKTFQESQLLNKNYLLNNDIKILEFTATPDGAIYDFDIWKNYAEKIFVETGVGYIGSFDLLQRGQVKQYKQLYNENEDVTTEQIVTNFNELISDIDSFNEPRYHIIRAGKGERYKNIMKSLKRYSKNININKNKNKYKYILYDKYHINDINDLLNIKPEVHTVIFVKEKLRCAKTLKKKYLGILYENLTKCTANDSVIIQGLVGRLNGYDTNDSCICYTNIESIKKYELLFSTKWEAPVVWNSNTTKKISGVTTSKGTYNGNFENDSSSSSDSEDYYNDEPIIVKRKTFDDIIDFIKANKIEYSPRKPKVNSNGLYESVVRSKKDVFSCDEIFAERKQGLSNDNHRLYTCYQDKNDKDTLEFWLIYKQPMTSC